MTDAYNPFGNGHAQALADLATELVEKTATGPTQVNARLLLLLASTAAAGARSMDMDRADYEMFMEAAWKRTASVTTRRRK